MWLAQRLPGSALPHLLLFPLPWNFFFRAVGGNMANCGDFFNGLLAKQQGRFPRSTTMKVRTSCLGVEPSADLRPGRAPPAPHQLRLFAVYPQQHIRTSHRAPVRKILAGLLLLVTDDVGKQSPRERAFRHPSVRASRRQHGDGHVCKPRRAKHVVVHLGQHDAAKAGHERRTRMRHAALRLRRRNTPPFFFFVWHASERKKNSQCSQDR